MSPTRLFVGGLPDWVGREEVYKFLSVYGKIIDVKVLPGYGFITYEVERDALDVVSTFASRPFLDNDVTIEVARPPSGDGSGGNNDNMNSPARPRNTSKRDVLKYPVAITNLNSSICWQELKDFSRLAGGLVAFCYIDRYDRRRGIVEYVSREDAENAVQKLNGKELLGNNVNVAHFCESRESRPRREDYKAPRERSRSPPPRRSYAERTGGSAGYRSARYRYGEDHPSTRRYSSGRSSDVDEMYSTTKTDFKPLDYGRERHRQAWRSPKCEDTNTESTQTNHEHGTDRAEISSRPGELLSQLLANIQGQED